MWQFDNGNLSRPASHHPTSNENQVVRRRPWRTPQTKTLRGGNMCLCGSMNGGISCTMPSCNESLISCFHASVRWNHLFCLSSLFTHRLTHCKALLNTHKPLAVGKGTAQLMRGCQARTCVVWNMFDTCFFCWFFLMMKTKLYFSSMFAASFQRKWYLQQLNEIFTIPSSEEWCILCIYHLKSKMSREHLNNLWSLTYRNSLTVYAIMWIN